MPRRALHRRGEDRGPGRHPPSLGLDTGAARPGEVSCQLARCVGFRNSQEGEPRTAEATARPRPLSPDDRRGGLLPADGPLPAPPPTTHSPRPHARPAPHNTLPGPPWPGPLATHLQPRPRCCAAGVRQGHGLRAAAAEAGVSVGPRLPADRAAAVQEPSLGCQLIIRAVRPEAPALGKGVGPAPKIDVSCEICWAGALRVAPCGSQHLQFNKISLCY